MIGKQPDGAENVSRETIERLRLYEALLKKWNKRINIVSESTLERLWHRHFLDSMQVFHLAPKHAEHWADLGSGGGFPGAVVAILAREARSNIRVTLVESDQRKAAFLRTLARETDVSIQIVAERIEKARPLAADVVSARALAPLPRLLEYASRHLCAGGVAIFPKGQSAQKEISEALETWRFRCETHPSQTDEEAVVLRIGDIERV